MSTQANTASGSFESSVASPVLTVPRPFYWSVRRELWEHRSIYIAPLAVAGVALFGFLIATIGRAMATHDLAQRRAVLEEPYHFAIALIMGAYFIVSIFYSVDALYGERRDRSILFWKSLPVSDLTTVLAKASIPLMVLPLLSFAIAVVTLWIMALLSTAVLWGSGLSARTLWTQVSHFQISLLYHLVTVHMLWYAPIYGWLLLVSAWARRAPILWATLPVLAIGALEKIAFNTTHIAALVKYRFTGPEDFDFPASGKYPMGPMSHSSFGNFLGHPGLWLGFAFAAVFLAAAIRQRRYQGPV